MKKSSLYIIVLVTSGILTILSLILHFSSLQDRLTAFERLEDIVYLHKVSDAFSHRSLTSQTVSLVSELTSLRLGKAFVLVNFGFLLLSGCLIGLVGSIFNNTRRAIVLNITLYFLTFSIFFIFFSPIYSYDEPIQYTFILLSFIALMNNRLFIFSLFFTIAMITRETSVVLLPGFYYLYSAYKRDNSLYQPSLIIALIVPVVAYVGFIGLFFSFDTNLKIIERFGLLKYNFQDFQFSIESVISFVLVIGLSLYLYLRLRTLKMNRVEGAFKKAFFITLVINSILVFGMAYAREARLFALPLFFAWPILTNLLLSESFEWKIGFDFRSGVFLTLVLGAGVIAYYSAIHYYDPVIGSGAGGYFHLYFSFLIGFVIFDLLFKKVKV